MKDYLGNEVREGDLVITTTASKSYWRFRKCIITEIREYSIYNGEIYYLAVLEGMKSPRQSNEIIKVNKNGN